MQSWWQWEFFIIFITYTLLYVLYCVFVMSFCHYLDIFCLFLHLPQMKKWFAWILITANHQWTCHGKIFPQRYMLFFLLHLQIASEHNAWQSVTYNFIIFPWSSSNSFHTFLIECYSYEDPVHYFKSDITIDHALSVSLVSHFTVYSPGQWHSRRWILHVQ